MRYNENVIIDLISMRGGDAMRMIFDIILAVIAQVIGNYLCKWLDSKIKKDDN